MKGRKKTGQNILHYVIASNVVIVFIIAILGGYLFRFYYKKMQEDFDAFLNQLFIDNVSNDTLTLNYTGYFNADCAFRLGKIPSR